MSNVSIPQGYNNPSTATFRKVELHIPPCLFNIIPPIEFLADLAFCPFDDKQITKAWQGFLEHEYCLADELLGGARLLPQRDPNLFCRHGLCSWSTFAP
jgi:hypothetical protein